MTNQTAIDWYERRDELRVGQVFKMWDGHLVKLECRTEGDGTRWDVLDRCGDHWSSEDGTIEPGDLVEMVPDPFAA